MFHVLRWRFKHMGSKVNRCGWRSEVCSGVSENRFLRVFFIFLKADTNHWLRWLMFQVCPTWQSRATEVQGRHHRPPLRRPHTLPPYIHKVRTVAWRVQKKDDPHLKKIVWLKKNTFRNNYPHLYLSGKTKMTLIVACAVGAVVFVLSVVAVIVCWWVISWCTHNIIQILSWNRH